MRAPALERTALLESFRRRDVYATSGPRIFLATRLAGKPMGSKIPATSLVDGDGLLVDLAGTAGIVHVDLIRKGRVVERTPCGGVTELALELDVAGLAAGDYVYVRVLQTDGAQAWSSPYYVE